MTYHLHSALGLRPRWAEKTAPRWNPHRLLKGKQVWIKLSRHGSLYTFTDSILHVPPRFAPVAFTLSDLSSAISGKIPLVEHPQDGDDPHSDYQPTKTSWRTKLDNTRAKGVYFNPKLRRWVPVKVVKIKRTPKYEHIVLKEDHDDPRHPQHHAPPQPDVQ